MPIILQILGMILTLPVDKMPNFYSLLPSNCATEQIENCFLSENEQCLLLYVNSGLYPEIFWGHRFLK